MQHNSLQVAREYLDKWNDYRKKSEEKEIAKFWALKSLFDAQKKSKSYVVGESR